MKSMDGIAAAIGCIMLAVVAAVPLTVLAAMVVWGLKEMFRKDRDE